MVSRIEKLEHVAQLAQQVIDELFSNDDYSGDSLFVRYQNWIYAIDGLSNALDELKKEPAKQAGPEAE